MFAHDEGGQGDDVIYASGKRGGCLATVVHSFMQTGDPNARSITQRIMKIVSQPLLQVINRWIYNGELYDPFQEV